MTPLWEGAGLRRVGSTVMRIAIASREPVDQPGRARQVSGVYRNRENKCLERVVIDRWDGYVAELVLV